VVYIAADFNVMATCKRYRIYFAADISVMVARKLDIFCGG
jgi:hypothetical protein